MTKKKRIRTTNPNNFKPSKRGWTTDPQEEFLLTHLPAYRTCQATKKFDKFWIEVERNFAKQWPVPPPTEMEGENRVTQKDKNAERKKNIHSWFNNKSRDRKQKIDASLLQFKLSKKRNKIKHNFQAYSRLYYDDRVKALANERWQEVKRAFEAGEIKELPARITVGNEVTSEVYDAESEDIKAESAAFRQKYNAAIDAGEDPEASDDDMEGDSDGDSHDVTQAMAYLEAQKASPHTLGIALQQLLVKTGYVGALVLAAPNPEEAGDITTLSLFCGNDPDGGDFCDFIGGTATFQKSILDKVGSFAEKVYPPSERGKWVIPGTKPKGRIVVGAPAARTSSSSTEPATAIPRRLKSRLASSRANSQTRTPSTLRSSHSFRRLETPQPLGTDLGLGIRSHSLHGPNSTTTQNPGFDQTPLSPEGSESSQLPDDMWIDDTDKQEQGWKVDKALSVKERASIAAQGSLYEQERMYSILLNKRSLAELGLTSAIDDLFKGQGKEGSERSTFEGSRAASPPHLEPSPSQSPSAGPFSPTGGESSSRWLPEAALDQDKIAQLKSLVDGHPHRNKWPEWLEPAVHALESMCVGKPWWTLILDWLEVENMLGYPTGKGPKNCLDSKLRPDEMAWWIKRKRRYDAMPDISQNVDEFASGWWDWYISLQPEWRIKQTDAKGTALIKQKPEDADCSEWGDIKKGGPNGIFSLLLTLGWWGVGASGQAKLHADNWTKAYDDLRWVLDALLEEGIRSEGEEGTDSESEEGEVVVPRKRSRDSDASETAAKRQVYILQVHEYI